MGDTPKKPEPKREAPKPKEPYSKPVLRKYDKLHKIGIGD